MSVSLDNYEFKKTEQYRAGRVGKVANGIT